MKIVQQETKNPIKTPDTLNSLEMNSNSCSYLSMTDAFVRYSQQYQNSLCHSPISLLEQRPTTNFLKAKSIEKYNKRRDSNIKQKYQSMEKNKKNIAKYHNLQIYLRLKPEMCETTNFIIHNQKSITIHANVFTCDKVFRPQTSQEKIFQTVAKPIIEGLFQGHNGSILAYGQTGAGKTYTMFGSKDQLGLIQRVVNYLFQVQQVQQLHCQIMEIYQEQIYDLLTTQKQLLKIKGNKKICCFTDSLKHVHIKDSFHFSAIMHKTIKKMRYGSTKMNESSSRSHTIFTLLCKISNCMVKLNLVDLAGSQKLSMSGAQGQTLKETKQINYSLSCLGNVISALASDASYIPFRNCKLTRILEDSLSTNCLTGVIACCSSLQTDLHQTLSTLKFAERAKHVKIQFNKEERDQKSKEIQKMRTKIIELKNQLQNTEDELRKYKLMYQEKQSNQSEIKAILHNMTVRQNYVFHNIDNVSSLNVSNSYQPIESPSISLSESQNLVLSDASLSFNIHTS